MKDVLYKHSQYKNSQKIVVELHNRSIDAKRVAEAAGKELEEASALAEMRRKEIEDEEYKKAKAVSGSQQGFGGYKSASAYKNAKKRQRDKVRHSMSAQSAIAPQFSTPPRDV